jgi:hypothetical protein
MVVALVYWLVWFCDTTDSLSLPALLGCFLF